LLLCTEALFKTWPQRSLAPQDQNSIWEPIDFLHDTLERMEAKSPFLKSWYLLWEAFRQSQIMYRWNGWPEYLNAGRSAFPDDARILLAAGSRKELEWWTVGIPRRLVGDVPNPVREQTLDYLLQAKKLLRRSVDADPRETEARLRLAHVLIELDEFGEAEAILATTEWETDEPAFEYLARLLEGAVNERKGNAEAALTSYDRAIDLVAASQTARLAKARLLRASERRAEAVAAATAALNESSSQLDPWWVFINGQAWRRDVYLKAARSMVIR
jgi:tetratricopeptide (TPR) repeat protein